MFNIALISFHVEEVYKRSGSNVVDQNGKPAFGHVKRVADSTFDLKLKTLAYLHDVIEDKVMTYDDVYMLLNLAYIGNEEDKFNDIADVFNGLVYITRPIGCKTDKEYFEYIETLKSNEFARKVKILDLKSNIYHPYERKLTEKDAQRTVKYMRSLMILEN